MTLPPHMQLFETLQSKVSARETVKPAQIFELSPDQYLNSERLEKEKREVFRTRPVIIGHMDQLKRAGDFFTHDHLGTPLLVVKGQDEVVRVFLNVCRHRGMRLVTDMDAGRKPAFVCPYHNWTYGLEGDLEHVPLQEAFDGADLSCRSLKGVRCQVKHGFIWVQLDDTPIDVTDWLGSINSDLEALDTQAQYLFRQTTTVRKTNWKLIIEAFQDGYHVTRLHKKTVGPFFEDSVYANDQEGEHLRAAVMRQEFSETFDLPPEQWDARRHVSFSHYIFPNTILVFHPDYISHLGLFPQSVDETVICHSFLVPEMPQTEKAIDHCERSFDLIENGVFQSEDYFACENIQAGLMSGANDTLLVGAHEDGIRLFHDILETAMCGG